MKNIEKQFNRWNTILRVKAMEYEHEARKKGDTVTSPDIDDICNEKIGRASCRERV